MYVNDDAQRHVWSGVTVWIASDTFNQASLSF